MTLLKCELQGAQVQGGHGTQDLIDSTTAAGETSCYTGHPGLVLCLSQCHLSRTWGRPALGGLLSPSSQGVQKPEDL